MPLRPSTRTLGDLTQNVKRIFGDEAGVQLDNADITRWVNDAQMEIVTSNKALKARSSISTVAGQASYTFPDVKIQQIASLHYDNAPIPNVPFAQAEQQILTQDPQQEEMGVPSFWYEWDGTLSLWPKPDAAAPLTLYYTAYPEEMSGSSDEFLGVPDKFYNSVVDYVLAKCYEMDEAFDASQLAEQRFRTALEAQMEDERQAAHMVYPVIQEVGFY
jgi:hypothetical protein|tara:strand:- start:8155 stop:8805 length:651 start_codon:yes stop_codon:yes gene_type:complete